MLYSIAVVALTLFAVASGSPWGPWGGAGAYAGAGGAIAGAGGYPAYPTGPSPFFWPFGGFPFGYPFPHPIFMGNWYDGPNVCKEENEFMEDDPFSDIDDSSNDNHESCRSTESTAVCVKTLPRLKDQPKDKCRKLKTKYECCHGFVRRSDGYPGCEEIDLRDLLPTLRDMGALKLVEMAEKAGLSDSLHSRNYTIFCPLNSALDAFEERQQDEQNNEILVEWNKKTSTKKTESYTVLTSHMTSGFLRSDDLENDQILQTANPDAKIRMNVYFTPEKVVTANCIPMVSANHFARNGIVHLVEKILPFPTKTVADIIAGDSQFSVLKGMLSRAGLVQTLRNPNGTFTIFAPTDSAYQAASLVRGNGTTCTVSVMKHHILDHVICSSALPQYARSLNMIGELLTLSRDEHYKLYVDDVQIVVRDLVAVNGVVHVIDGLLTTRQAKSISQTLKDDGFSEFLSLLEAADLKDEFDAMENVTFFVPTNEAIKNVPSSVYNDLINDKSTLRNILVYHAVNKKMERRKGMTEETLESKLENRTIRMQIYSSHTNAAQQAFVQCATVLSPDNKLCGSTMHVINRMLFPPRPTLVDILENTEGFSTLVLLLRATGLERRLGGALGVEETFTFLAPTDDAFHRLGDGGLFQLFEDIIRARDLVRMHILPGTVCCSQLKNDLLTGRHRTRSLDGSLLALQRSYDGSLLIGGARIVDCEIMANNGIVHMVDSILRHEVNGVVQPQYLDSVYIRL